MSGGEDSSTQPFSLSLSLTHTHTLTHTHKHTHTHRYSRRELTNVLSVSGDEQFNSTILMLKIMENHTRSSLSEISSLLRSIQQRLETSASVLFRQDSAGGGGGGGEKEHGAAVEGEWLGDVRGEDRQGTRRVGHVGREEATLALLVDMIGKQGEMLRKQGWVLDQHGADLREIKERQLGQHVPGRILLKTDDVKSAPPLVHHFNRDRSAPGVCL